MRIESGPAAGYDPGSATTCIRSAGRLSSELGKRTEIRRGQGAVVRPVARTPGYCEWRAAHRNLRCGRTVPAGQSIAPGRTRTSNLLVRSQPLYPIELRALRCCVGPCRTGPVTPLPVSVALIIERRSDRSSHQGMPPRRAGPPAGAAWDGPRQERAERWLAEMLS